MVIFYRGSSTMVGFYYTINTYVTFFVCGPLQESGNLNLLL